MCFASAIGISQKLNEFDLGSVVMRNEAVRISAKDITCSLSPPENHSHFS